MRIHSVKKVIIGVGLSVLALAGVALASHSWGNYHWARTANPFTLKLGDNVSSAWDAYLAEASADWSVSSVLDTSVVRGSTKPFSCKPKFGQVEVCSAKYGFNGWLGVASIWVSGNHITQGTVKLNDSYFNTATYNTPSWRRLVMCQEVGHTFGLDHQDEIFNNPNLGTCMDYTSDPDGPPSNEHPNAHDYEQLEAIYSHLDSIIMAGRAFMGRGNRAKDTDAEDVQHGVFMRTHGYPVKLVQDAEDVQDWGEELRRDGKGRTSHWVKDLGRGEKVFTFILWAE